MYLVAPSNGFRFLLGYTVLFLIRCRQGFLAPWYWHVIREHFPAGELLAVAAVDHSKRAILSTTFFTCISSRSIFIPDAFETRSSPTSAIGMSFLSCEWKFQCSCRSGHVSGRFSKLLQKVRDGESGLHLGLVSSQAHTRELDPPFVLSGSSSCLRCS